MPVAPDRAKKFTLNQVATYTYDTTLAVGSLILSGVLDRHPRLRLILSHGGGTLPYLVGRFDRMYRASDHAAVGIVIRDLLQPGGVEFHERTFRPQKRHDDDLGVGVPDHGEVLVVDLRLGDESLPLLAGSSGTNPALTVLGILTALWSASSGMKALITGVNLAYDETESRNALQMIALEPAATLRIPGARTAAEPRFARAAAGDPEPGPTVHELVHVPAEAVEVGEGGIGPPVPAQSGEHGRPPSWSVAKDPAGAAFPRRTPPRACRSRRRPP